MEAPAKLLPMDALSILNKRFGHAAFRGQQEAIIDRTMAGGHSLVIMPTGGGKSLCYQVPALLHAATADRATTEKPLTLVLSPLIALMKDQVDALQDKGIRAAFINSSLNRQERENRYQQVANGRFDLLYVTPERFRKPDFIEVLAQRDIRLLAVDEAHCISEWGHDFRPDYTRLREFRKLVGDPTTIALTATATPDVQQDIVRQLGLQPDDVSMFHEGIDRPNLAISVEEVWGNDEKLAQIENIVRKYEESDGNGIVYFTLIKTLDMFSELLRKKKMRHFCYHGKLERRDRRRVQLHEVAELVCARNQCVWDGHRQRRHPIRDARGNARFNGIVVSGNRPSWPRRFAIRLRPALRRARSHHADGVPSVEQSDGRILWPGL
jgi:ATP-dependent DNA helicase RecQ